MRSHSMRQRVVKMVVDPCGINMKNSFFESGPPRGFSFGEEIRIVVLKSIGPEDYRFFMTSLVSIG